MSKSYFWLIVWKIHRFAYETHAFGWSSASDAFCKRLSYLEHTNSRANTLYLRRKNSRYFFATSFDAAKPEHKTVDFAGNYSMFIMTTLNFSVLRQESRRICFEKKKLNVLKLTKNFEQSRPIFRQKSRLYRPGNLGIVSLFRQIQSSVDLHTSSLKYLLSAIYHGWGMILQQFRFREEYFFKGEEKVLAFLATTTPVIWKIECQKTFGKNPRSVCNTIHVFDNTNNIPMK